MQGMGSSFVSSILNKKKMTPSNQKWVFDFSHSKIGFSVRHFGITETGGQFRKFEGSIISEKPDFSDVQVDVTIDVSSIDTNDAQRDGHLLSADFFEVEKFPIIHFKSHKIEPVNKDNYKMLGDLTIKGTTQAVSLDVKFSGIVPKDPFGNTKAGLLVSGKINRKDYGMTWNAALDHGGVAVSETVKFNIPIQLLKVT
jgi:polyisoprenoid-binding protein YceI